MELKIRSKVAGYYKLEAVKLDKAGNEVSRRVVADWFPNLITNQGLNRMGANADYLSNCQVGSGSDAPPIMQKELLFSDLLRGLRPGIWQRLGLVGLLVMDFYFPGL
jgi:hypothetical protein